MRTVRVDHRDLLTEDVDLVSRGFAGRAVRCRDLAFLDGAVIADEELRNLALDGTGFRDGFRADDADVVHEHLLVVAGIIQRLDLLAVRDRDGVLADGDDIFIRDQLDAAVPVLILDGDSGDFALLRIDDERLAHAEFAAFGDADDRQAQDFYTFLHTYSPKSGFHAWPCRSACSAACSQSAGISGNGVASA